MLAASSPASPKSMKPTNAPLGSLQLGGDFAATIECDTARGASERCFLVAVRRSTRQVWTIPSRAGSRFTDVLAVGPSEIVAAESDAAPGPEWKLVQRIVRLRTGALDRVASRR